MPTCDFPVPVEPMMAIRGCFGGARVILEALQILRKQRSIEAVSRDCLVGTQPNHKVRLESDRGIAFRAPTIDAVKDFDINRKSLSPPTTTTCHPPSIPLEQNCAHPTMSKDAPAPSIGVNDLTFAFPDGSTGLKNISLDLPPGSRTLLIGGKSFPVPAPNIHGMLNPEEQMAPARRPSCASSPASAWLRAIP